MATDYSTMRTTNTTMHNTSVFDNIGKDMDRIANLATKKRTKRMARILKTRRELKGSNGHFPRSEKPRSNGHSFRDWGWKARGKGKYALINDHRNPNDDYPYVRNLISGKHWSDRVKQGTWKKLVKGVNGGLFSTQMPNGLNPWFVVQRELLKKDIIRMINGKKGLI